MQATLTSMFAGSGPIIVTPPPRYPNLDASGARVTVENSIYAVFFNMFRESILLAAVQSGIRKPTNQDAKQLADLAWAKAKLALTDIEFASPILRVRVQAWIDVHISEWVEMHKPRQKNPAIVIEDENQRRPVAIGTNCNLRTLSVCAHAHVRELCR
jgi:hypothetical protein